MNIVDLDGEMAKPSLVRATGRGVVALLIRRRVLPQLKERTGAPQHYAVRRGVDESDRRIYVGGRCTPMVTLDFDHVEQRSVKRDCCIKVVDNDAGVMNAPDAHASRRSRIWTMLPAGSRT